MRNDRMEDIVLFVSVGLLLAVFMGALYVMALRPSTETWDVRVFDCVQKKGYTLVMSYGDGYKHFEGHLELDLDTRYIITYFVRPRLNEVIHIEEVKK